MVSTGRLASPKRSGVGVPYIAQVKNRVRPYPIAGKACYIDFEYRDDALVCVSMLFEEPNTESSITSMDLRTDAQLAEFRKVARHLIEAGTVFVGHNVGMAEMTAMLRAGIDLTGSKWIDTFTESKMIGSNHPYFSMERFAYLACLQAFQITPRRGSHHAWKEAMHQLILSKTEYTADEFEEIVRYCESDVVDLPDLLSHIMALHEHSGAPFDPLFMLYRGDYILADTMNKWRTRGVPVDAKWWSDVKRHQVAIRDTLCRESNVYYKAKLGVEFFHPKLKRSQSQYAFGVKRFGDWVKDNDLPWETTRSGRARLDRDYIDDAIRRFPDLKPLKETRDALTAMRAIRLEVVEGYAASGARTFHTVTGRNQPMVKEGFIFNMAPVFRVAGTKPKPGMAMIAADWSKQEPAIAIALSGDQNYFKAYTSEDLYMTCAIRAGAAPAGATEDTHPIIRQAFKAAMLGIGYGMGVDTLAKAIYAEVNRNTVEIVMTHAEALERAAAIHQWHKQEFHVLWSYLLTKATEARQRGWASAEDGWMTYVSPRTKETQLINFPIQANGAAMLRAAVISLANETNLDVPFTLHDAIYVNCPVEEIAATKVIMAEHMDRAAKSVMGPNAITIKIGFKIITADSPLDDKRANKLLPLINDTIAALNERERELNSLLVWSEPTEGYSA